MVSQNKFQDLPNIQLGRSKGQHVDGNTGLAEWRTAKALSWRLCPYNRIRNRKQRQSTHGSISHITEWANEGEQITTD